MLVFIQCVPMKNEEWMTREALLAPTEFVEGRFALRMLFCIVCYVARIERSKVSICIIYAFFVPSAFVERRFALIRILLHCDIL